jgi:hypothetical protein
MDFVSGVTWRSSQRGLVVCGAGGSSLLIEHERAAELPALLGDASNADELAALLGGADADRQVVADLVAERIVADPTKPVREPHVAAVRRVVFTRSGVEFTGIDGVATVVHRVVMPVLESWWGRIAIGVVVVAGVIALIVGRT